MNKKIFAALAIIATIAGLESKVQAQSSTGKQTISGNALTGIDNRTAEDDFARFFSVNNSKNVSRNNIRENIVLDEVRQIGDQLQLRRNQPLSAPNNVIFPQPDQSFNGNDGAQVQVDLGRLDSNSNK